MKTVHLNFRMIVLKYCVTFFKSIGIDSWLLSLLFYRGKSSGISVSGLSHGQCHAVVLHITGNSQYSTVLEYFVDVKG